MSFVPSVVLYVCIDACGYFDMSVFLYFCISFFISLDRPFYRWYCVSLCYVCRPLVSSFVRQVVRCVWISLFR